MSITTRKIFMLKLLQNKNQLKQFWASRLSMRSTEQKSRLKSSHLIYTEANDITDKQAEKSGDMQ